VSLIFNEVWAISRLGWPLVDRFSIPAHPLGGIIDRLPVILFQVLQLTKRFVRNRVIPPPTLKRSNRSHLLLLLQLVKNLSLLSIFWGKLIPVKSHLIR